MAGPSSYMHFQHYQPQQHPQQRQTPYNLNNPTTAQSSFYPAGYAYYNPVSTTTYRNVTSVASGSGPQQQATSTSNQQSQTSPGQAAPATPSFRAPAHKNSHHLHSIPPREKSTRTLIVDHMLWVHGRTRLAQARAELGMTDRTGGPSSSNYIHRTRPENYEEEDEVDSDGEDGDVLLGWTDDAGTVKVKDEWEKKEKERLGRQDLPLARTLRLRAEGLEKVVTSMLGQPPALQPATPNPLPPSFHPSSSSSTGHPAASVPSSTTSTAVANHPALGPSSGQHQPTSDSHLHGHSHSHSTSSRTRTGRHPHILPNGVRLRLALGTLINDFFARQAPHPPYRHIQSRRASRASSPISRHASQSESAAGGEVGEDQEEGNGEGEGRRTKKAADMGLPKALLPLTLISGGIKSSSHTASSTTSSSDEQEEEDGEDDPMRGNQSPYDLDYPPDYISYGAQNSSSFYQPTHQPVGLSPFAVPDFHQQQQYQSFSLPGQSESRFGLSSPARITRSLPKMRRNRTKPKPSARTIELYETGVDSARASASHSSFRCPRHLYIGCQVCVEAKGGSSGASSSGGGFKAGGSGSSGRTSGMGSINVGVSTTQGVGMVGNSATYASNSSAASSSSALAGILMGTSGGGAAGGTGGNITGWKDGTGIGTGLLKPDMRGSVLRRSVALPGSPPQANHPTSSGGKSPVGHARSPSTQTRVQSSSPQSKKSAAKETEQSYEQETGTGNTKLSKLIPRFIKLSALVAGELGREIRGEEVDASAVLQVDSVSKTSTSGAGPHRSSTQACKTAAADAGDADESGSESEGDSGSGSEGSRKSRAADSATPTPVKREEGTPRPPSSPFKGTTVTPSSTSTSSPAQPPVAHPPTNKHQAQQYGQHHHHPNHIRHGKRAHEKMYAYALQPTREWYLLLAGLLTRAVLEGYLTAGWSGIGCVECLMGVGVGVKKQERSNRKENLDSCGNTHTSTSTHGHSADGGEECVGEGKDEDDYADEDDALFEEVEPDEYPTLKEALRVLFPSLRCNAHGKEKEADKSEKAGKGEAEKEYEEEMYRRLRMFYEIPESTPDLSAHMEDLAWRFPAEPIERAAVRFCEAIAKWRGKPELEGYKKSKTSIGGFTSPGSSNNSLSGALGSTMITMESFVHSNPTSPAQLTTKGRKEGRKTGIGAYFISAAEERRKKAEEEQRRKSEREVWSLKRGREDDSASIAEDGSFGGVKRVRL